MADERAELPELFSSKVRAVVLAYLLPRPHLGRSLTELSRLLDLPISSLQHECYKLARLGVLRDWRDGGSRRYQADPGSPLVAPLTALIAAAIGREAALRAAVDEVEGLEFAFLVGATAPQAATDPVQVVLVGEMGLDALDGTVRRIAAALDLPSDRIEAAFFRPADWRHRVASGNAYAVEVTTGPRLMLAPAPDGHGFDL